MKKDELIKKIDKTIENEMMRSGKMGTETVSVNIALTEEEIQLFCDIDKYNTKHYCYEFEGNNIRIDYTEEPDRVKLIYEEGEERIELGKVFTNNSISVDYVLGLLEIDMDEVANERGWDDWNYDALKIEY